MGRGGEGAIAPTPKRRIFELLCHASDSLSLSFSPSPSLPLPHHLSCLLRMKPPWGERGKEMATNSQLPIPDAHKSKIQNLKSIV